MAIGSKVRRMSNLNVGEYEFEGCSDFKFLGVTITRENIEEVEIENRIAAANRCFWAVQNLMSKQILSRTTKTKNL